MTSQGSDTPEVQLQLAEGFNDVIRLKYPGAVPIAEVAGGCATFLVGYLTQCTPSERACILSSMVDSVLEGFHAEHDADIEFTLN
jgi:hypothetical protein